jgi:hypothetical protein
MKLRSLLALLAPLVLAASSLLPQQSPANIIVSSGPKHFVEEAAFDMDADWVSRSRASGVFLANNFNEKRVTATGVFTQSPYADSTALRAASTTSTAHLDGVREVTLNADPTRALSGGKSLSIKTFGSNTAHSGGGWQNQYKDNLDEVNGFYLQFAVYMQRDALAWRLPGTSGEMKVFNLEQFGGGQIVVMAGRHQGFPTLLINGSGLMERNFASVPYKGGGDWYYQTAIDSGSSLAAGTRQAWIRRYGPSREVSNGVLGDYGYNSSAETGGDPAGNMLYNRGFNWPNSDAIAAGAVPFNMDGWTVVEVYVNNADFDNPVEAFDSVKMWVAAYGDAPVLVCDLNALPNDDPQSLNTIISAYQRFELLWYDTSFGNDNVGEDVGYRPTQQRWYAEILGSMQPINFPGGHALP